MQFPTLSRLQSLPDGALWSLHDSLHGVLGDVDEEFLSWYHAEVLAVLDERSLIHHVNDALDKKTASISDFELTTEKEQKHRHASMINRNGSGFTDPVEGHYHMIRNGRILNSASHAHKLTIPFKITESQSDSVTALLFSDALFSSFSRSSLLTVAKTSVEETHSHNVVILDSAKGNGVTTFNNGHLHTIVEWSLSEADCHVHSVNDDDYQEIPNLSEMFDALLNPTDKSKSSSSNTVTKRHRETETPSRQASPKSTPPSAEALKVAFGNPVSVPSQITRALSAEKAWKTWETKNADVLITSWFPGDELEAHVEVTQAEPIIHLYLRGKDVTRLFKRVHDSLKVMEFRSVGRVILTGNVTSRFEKSEGAQTIQGILDGSINDGGAAFYVEDCVFLDGSLQDVSAMERRRQMEKLLAGSTTPVLKHLPRAQKSGHDEVIRITNKSLQEDGAALVRWRRADGNLSDRVVETHIISE